MSKPATRAVVPDLPAAALAIALAVSLLALGAALMTHASRPKDAAAVERHEKGRSRCYSAPPAATTLARRFERAAPSGMGEEHAPLAQRYAAGFLSSGNIDSPRGGPPSRLSHHSSSRYDVGTLWAAANMPWATGSSFRPTTVT